MSKQVVKTMVLVVALGGLGVAAAVALRKPPSQQAAPRESGTTLTGGADPSLPVQNLDAVTRYARVSYRVVDADYTHMPPSWSYLPIEKDW